ncbi:hypothetical protein F5888DRAFT_103302 [Russula emetica]|nr:hypothetical protein F5888DRAFT_103302 [Russula emetica]
MSRAAGDGRNNSRITRRTHTNMQIPPASSDLRSYSPSMGFPSQYQSPTSPAYPAGHSPSRGAVPPPAAPHAHYHQQSMAMSHASLDRNPPSARGVPQLPYARAPPPPPPVSYDTQVEAQEPTIKKKRKRADARQLDALNKMFAITAFPSTDQRNQLARDLDMAPRSVQIWFQNKRQQNRQNTRNPAYPGPSVSQVTATLHPEVQHVPIHPRASPAPMSPMDTTPYPSRSPLPVMMRSGQTPSPPSGRSRANIDPRRNWPGPSPGY